MKLKNILLIISFCFSTTIFSQTVGESYEGEAQQKQIRQPQKQYKMLKETTTKYTESDFEAMKKHYNNDEKYQKVLAAVVAQKDEIGIKTQKVLGSSYKQAKKIMGDKDLNTMIHVFRVSNKQ